MKTITTLLARSFLTVALLGSAVTLYSQDAPRRPQAGGDGQRPGQRPQAGFQPGNFVDPSLTEEQRQALREAFEPDREQTIELFRRMARVRKELQDATFAEKADTETIRSKAAEIGKVEGEMAVLRAKGIERVRARLTPEQLERLKNNPLLGGFSTGMGQGGQRPATDYRRPGAGDDTTPRRPQRPAATEDKDKQ